VILGADHLALNCASVGDGQAALEPLGYETRFVESDLVNHEAKRPFLSSWSDRHTIAMLQRSPHLAIELTCHGMASGRSASYELLLPGEGVAGADSPFEVPAERRGVCWLGPSQSVPTVLTAAGDLATSARFWEGLGFVRHTCSEDALRYRLARPVAAWSLELLVRGPARTGALDDVGFTCLALLTRRLEQTLERAVACGGLDPSPPFEVRVAGKLLKVALVRSPGGSPVEFLEIGRG